MRLRNLWLHIVSAKRNFELRYALGADDSGADREGDPHRGPDRRRMAHRHRARPDQAVVLRRCRARQPHRRSRPHGIRAWHTYFLEVVVFEPPSRFAYRWLRDQAVKARPENSTL